MAIRILTVILVSICTTHVYGQYILDTPDGKKVKLNANGTWVYVKNDDPKKANSGVPKNSTAKYISRFKKYELWYDPAQWYVDSIKKTNGYTWDAYFFSADNAIQGYCMDTRLSTPIENFEKGIREQWQSTGEIKSFKSFKDTINNLPVNIFEMEYMQDAITYVYKGLVYSGPGGSFQLTIGTQKEIYEEDKNKIDLLLKGLTKK